jgi:hypothetical protein
MFASTELIKSVDIEQGRLNSWIVQGYIRPSIHEGERPGDHHVWSELDVYNMALFKKIIEGGFSRKIAFGFIGQGVISENVDLDSIGFILFARAGDRTDSAVIVYEPDDDLKLDIEHVLTQFDMFERDRQFDDLYLVNFKKLRHEIDAKIEGVRREAGQKAPKREKARKRIAERKKDLKERYPDLTKK